MKKRNYKQANVKKRKMLLSACFIFLLGVISYFLIQLYIVKSTDKYIIRDIAQIPQSDAVIVLGALVYQDGTPSSVLKDRLDYAYELYINGKAKKILVSGDHGKADYDEVNAMKNYLMSKGVSRKDIFMDHAGFDTYDSMYRAKEIFQIKSLIISTQNFHINRSLYIARKLGMDAYGYPCKDKEEYNMQALNQREQLARIKAFGSVLFGVKPKYLGEVIPISSNGILTEG